MEPLKQEMKPLTKVVSEWVHEYFKKTDIDISEEGNRATYEFTCELRGDFSYKGYVEIYEVQERVDVYLYAPVLVSARRRSEVAELLSHFNFGLVYGKVVMNPESGKISYNAEFELKEMTLSVAELNHVVDRGMSMLDDFLPAVINVAQVGMPVEDALVLLKGESSPAGRPDAEPTDKAMPWDWFVGNESLKAWANELAAAVKSGANQDAWSLTGQAAVVVNKDEDYCREALRRVAADAGMQFVMIPSDEVMTMVPPAAFRSLAPALVYLEPARWMLGEGEENESKEDAERVDSFQGKLIRWMGDFKPARPVVLVVSAHDLKDVAPRLRGVGRFDRFIGIPQRSLEFVGRLFLDEVGRDRCGATLQNAEGKVGRLVSWGFPQQRSRELLLLSLRRIHARKNRPLEFLDLVHLSTHDLLEEPVEMSRNEQVRRQTAYHEAGHAVVSVIETGGKDVPDYTSIVPGASGFGGITVESYSFYYANSEDQTTYQDFRRDIRVCLGGRAAEELSVGVGNISNGAVGDLDNATRSAGRAFARWGFAPSMDEPDKSESNLALVCGRASDSEEAHVEALVREFLANEYRIVRERLAANRALLDDVAERLMWDPIVDQDELAEICRKHGVEVVRV